MRFSLPILRRLSESIKRRDWVGIGFELFVVVLGVTLGVEASRWSAEREERAYRTQIITALNNTLDVYVEAGGEINREITTLMSDYERKLAAGQRPVPPYWRLDQLERPPTLAWDAMVATGIAKSVRPELVFQIARFFSRGDGFGDRYQRYNQFTESRILPQRGNPAYFYGPDGKLLPDYAAHVDRLRELLQVNNKLTREAALIQAELAKR